MHRTQILLEEHQYRRLRALARRDGKSMGQLVRELLRVALDARRADNGDPQERTLSDLCGCVGEASISGRDHDLALYGDG